MPVTPPAATPGTSVIEDSYIDSGVLVEPDESTSYAGMTGFTAYNHVEGEFFLKALPLPDKQNVKKTIQGITDTFRYETDDISIRSLVDENDRVKITELTYQGETNRIMNSAMTKTAVNPTTSDPYNRIFIEYGAGEYENFGSITLNQSASTFDEIIAIAVDDIRPFLLKNMDIQHTADFTTEVIGGVTKYTPTNPVYIQHLTPEKEPRVAVIESPSVLTAAGGPNQILVYYDAIDLTGEVVAGTGLTAATHINTYAKDWVASGNCAHLVVRKTIPSACSIYTIGGLPRTLSDILKQPYDTAGAAPAADTIRLNITAPGGIISVPTKNLNRPLKSHILSSAPTGDITPSPFINIEDCMVTVQTGLRGYGRPKAVPSIVVPDPTTDVDYHRLTTFNTRKGNLQTYLSTKAPPSSLSKSNLSVFDIIDNEITQTENWILVHPSKHSQHSGLSDIITAVSSSNDPTTINIEFSLMRGRVEEIEPGTSTNSDSGLTITGRSLLMDLADQRSDRDFNLSEGTPLKEIGDLGTPTVSLSLGGPGQGAIDIKPSRIEHPVMPGWKDRIVGSGNASVRNDKQASTYYASTRALVEFPLFPSMFFDVDNVLPESTEKRSALPSDKSFEMVVDCTMTAGNRPQMKNYESRFAVDWGMRDAVSSFEVHDSIKRLQNYNGHAPLIRCQRPSVQGVIASINTGTRVLTLDDASAFLSTSETGAAASVNYVVTIGEGILADGLGYVAYVTAGAGNDLTISALTNLSLSNRGTVTTAAIGDLVVGMTVTFGGYLTGSNNASPTWNQQGWSYGSALTTAQIATSIADAVAFIMGKALTSALTTDITVDPNNSNRYFIKDGPNMEAFDFDCDETLDSFADRHITPFVECVCSSMSLKGKKADGTSLDYVQPLKIDFNNIATTKGDFDKCVDEVIRRINMAAHPLALDSNGNSAFNPPDLFSSTTSTDTGSHMGYVRAFLGEDIESKDGDKGKTIVIHSTVPGAVGRNFAVWFTNNTPYPYRPIQAIGNGGLLATNSLHYQANSFPAAMPIGFDGDTHIPITTFSGGAHGDLFEKSSTTPLRTYDGIGKRLSLTTKVPAATDEYGTAVLSADTIVKPIFASFNSAATPPIEHIAVDLNAEWISRIGKYVSSSAPGLLRIGRRYAHFTGIEPISSTAAVLGVTTVYIHDITPVEETAKFYEALFDTTGTAAEIAGLEVEIIWPLLDNRGILFFGGGHTGITLDVSDGTSSDYSDEYKHHYAKGPTGFAGLQNLHEVSTASAVLDFTNIKDEDTINENTLVGIHHKAKTDNNGMTVDDALFFLRLNDTLALTPASYPQNSEIIKEHIYGRLQRYSSALGTGGTKANSPTYTAGDLSASHIQFMHHPIAGPVVIAGHDYVICHDKNGAGTTIKSTLPHIDATGAVFANEARMRAIGAFTISAWLKVADPASATSYMTGPVIHGIDYDGFPWGLSISGDVAADAPGPHKQQYLNVAFHYVASSGAPGVQWIHNPLVAAGPNPVDQYTTIRKDQWVHIVAVFEGTTPARCRMYIASEVGLNQAAGATFVDYSPYTVVSNDELYNHPFMPNSRGNAPLNIRYPYNGNQPAATSEGVPDHPYVPLDNGPASTVDVSKGVRNKVMTTVGLALHGCPYVDQGTTMDSPTFTLVGAGLNSYYDKTGVAPATTKYGTVDTILTDGRNNVGPIYFTGGHIADVAVWDRALTSAEVQAIWDSRTVW